MPAALKHHWPEYLMEAAGLGIFMLSACVFAALLEHPASPVRQALSDPILRRILMGLAMGLTAVSIVYSPWGQQSGAHLNPSLPLTFLRLGKVAPWDAMLYVVAQFLGGVLGVRLASMLLGHGLAHPAVNYVATVPGAYGVGVAFLAEVVISCVLMTVVLTVSNTPQAGPFYGVARWCPGGDIHHRGSAALRHEYEPRPHLRLQPCGAGVDGPVALFYLSTPRYAAGCRALPTVARRTPGRLRQAAPS